MERYNLCVVLSIVVLVLVPSTVCGSDPLHTSCSPDARNYTYNSQFENNLKQLFESISSNISVSGGFYNISVGVYRDRIYGQAFCRPGYDVNDCQTCVDDAAREISKSCKTTEAIAWSDLCQVRYSMEMFSSMMVYPEQEFSDGNSSSNPYDFSQALMYLMKKLSGDEAAFNPSKQMVATGEIKYSTNITLYGEQKCTKNVSETDCKICFDAALGELVSCCSSRQGGTVVGNNCTIKFELYRFFDDGSTSPSKSSPDSKFKGAWKVVVIVISASLFLLAAVLIVSGIVRNRQRKGFPTCKGEEKKQLVLIHDISEEAQLVSSEELPIIDIATIKLATNDFSGLNKIGQGGFGIVYKGLLPDGKEVAVKRLSRNSGQGLEEFKNEVILIAKLQHRNLVRLSAWGFEGEEKLLLYEFMPNNSLDTFIFDEGRRAEFRWETYYNIIEGIAKGLLYLHEDSRLKIIHRDLKPSNILLDHEMVAKISDFGLARTFCESQDRTNTKRIVGTYGYIAPEYAMGGLFSVKSDVFSFGVILLEIISGKRNNEFFLRNNHGDNNSTITLLVYAWRLWSDGRKLEFIDPVMKAAGSSSSERELATDQMLRCMHIALLCVQEDPAERPNMSTVLVLLGSESSIHLPDPKQPAFCQAGRSAATLPTNSHASNALTHSIILPR